MKKKLFYILISISVLVLFYVFYLKDYRERTLIKKGNGIVVKIEAYKLKNGLFPESLNELIIEESILEEIFYNKIDSTNYIIWFGTSLGESKIFYSDSKKWEDGYRSIKH